MTALSTPQLSVIIPAHNERANIGRCLDDLLTLLSEREGLAVEVIVVNDNSSDDTEAVVRDSQSRWPTVRLLRRSAPKGFGRAVRAGLEFARGQILVIYMADCSDHPEDVLAYYRLIHQGYDCVFGSRFIRGSKVQGYPPGKLVANRIVNTLIQWLFWTKHNDLTNAFKAYRREVVNCCGPYRACHFNITLEMSLSALISGFRIAQTPIGWEGRTWGASKLKIREMGRRYLCTLIMLLAQRILMSDDVTAERTRAGCDCVEITDAALDAGS